MMCTVTKVTSSTPPPHTGIGQPQPCGQPDRKAVVALNIFTDTKMTMKISFVPRIICKARSGLPKGSTGPARPYPSTPGPTLLRPAGEPPPKRPYGHFRTPHAVRLCPAAYGQCTLDTLCRKPMLTTMGVWQGVAMDSLQFHRDPPCPTLLRPADRPCRGGPPIERAASGRLLPLWTPHAARLCLQPLWPCGTLPF
jgi:hypothetical protein